MIFEISGLFVNTLTTDDKHFFRVRENLQQPIQIQVSKRQTTFSEFFAASLKFTSIFEH